MSTETINVRFKDLDLWETSDVMEALLEAQLSAAAVAREQSAVLARAANLAAQRLRGNASGRLIYAGAGASGRLAVQDGVELFPTYGWPQERLVYLMAGGEEALVRSVELAEDDRTLAVQQVTQLGLGPSDVVICVAASGRTPFALGVAEAAREQGAFVTTLTNNSDTPLAQLGDCAIELVTGAEVVAGSTRMAAGTAQKIALNALSTAIMVRMNRTYSNLMVDLTSSNSKLERRRLAILQQIVAVDEEAGRQALATSGQSIKIAALILHGLSVEEAAALLERMQGSLREALKHA